MRCTWKTALRLDAACAAATGGRSVPVAAARAASAVPAMHLKDRVEAGRGLRRCYRDRGVSVAAARAASAVHTVYLEDRVEAGRGLRRCYRDRGVSVAAARAASAVHAVHLEDRVGGACGVPGRPRRGRTRLAVRVQACSSRLCSSTNCWVSLCRGSRWISGMFSSWDSRIFTELLRYTGSTGNPSAMSSSSIC